MSISLLARYGLTVPAGGAAVESPLVALLTSPTANTTNLQEGWEFTPSEELTAVGLRLYSSVSSVNETLRLWRVSDTTQLASASVVSVADEWVDVALGSSVTLASGTNYVVTTYAAAASRALYARTTADQFIGWSRRIAYVQGRTVGSSGFPTAANANIMRGIADVIVQGADAALPEVIERVGADTFADFGANIYGLYTPIETITLAGIRDAHQPSTITLQANVWETGVTGAPIATSPAVTQVGGLHDATFTTPVELVAGTQYRIGWIKTAGADPPKYTTVTSSSWVNFLQSPSMAYTGGTGYPGTGFSGNIPIDLVRSV